MARSKRYYAEFTETAAKFCSVHGRAWQVFDRGLVGGEASPTAMALCVSRVVAFKIRDALNKGGKA